MEVDFVTFAGLVDAVGGVNIDFPYPAFDKQSGLDVKQTGSVKLNGQQALAYVRSRHYTEIKEDGKPHEDPTADLGRIGRQQDFMRAVMYKVASTQNPISLVQGKRQDLQRAPYRRQARFVRRHPARLVDEGFAPDPDDVAGRGEPRRRHPAPPATRRRQGARRLQVGAALSFWQRVSRGPAACNGFDAAGRRRRRVPCGATTRTR